MAEDKKKREKNPEAGSPPDSSKRQFLKKGGMILLATGAYQVFGALTHEPPAAQAKWCRWQVTKTDSNCGTRGIREGLPASMNDARKWNPPPPVERTWSVRPRTRGPVKPTVRSSSALPEINERPIPGPRGR